MPPALHVLLLLAAGATIAACSNGNPTSSAKAAGTTASTQTQPLAVTPANQTFTITRGQTSSVGLPSAGDGGYQWHLEESYDRGVVRLKGQRSGEMPANAPTGRFADEIFDFEGLAPGRTTLVFSNYRSWEGPTRAVETRRFTITVQ